MKKVFGIIILCLLFNCKESNKRQKNVDFKPIETSEQTIVDSTKLKKYKSVKDMLEDGHDYTIEQGTLKFIDNDENNLHIQVSKPIIKNDAENLINETVKRDIVYVVFQSFAQTSINKITVTSIPIDFKDNKKYYNNYAQTVTVDREQADKIMKKEFGSTDYSILF